LKEKKNKDMATEQAKTFLHTHNPSPTIATSLSKRTKATKQQAQWYATEEHGKGKLPAW
jgi:hypothetical protein